MTLNIQSVVVAQDEYTVAVAQNQFYVVVQTSASIVTTGTPVEFLGSAMSGSDGGSSRTYVHTSGFSSSGKVYLGTANGMMRLASSKWSLSTTTVLNDTITILVPIYDTDTVVIDS